MTLPLFRRTTVMDKLSPRQRQRKELSVDEKNDRLRRYLNFCRVKVLISLDIWKK